MIRNVLIVSSSGILLFSKHFVKVAKVQRSRFETDPSAGGYPRRRRHGANEDGYAQDRSAMYIHRIVERYALVASLLILRQWLWRSSRVRSASVRCSLT